jgi:hypothetical protein
MYSIRNTLLTVISTAGLFALAGCQASWTRPQAVNAEPLTIDEAMQVRDWPQTEVNYPARGVTAGPILGFPWQEQTYRGAYWEPTYTAQPPLEVIAYEDRVTNSAR